MKHSSPQVLLRVLDIGSASSGLIAALREACATPSRQIPPFAVALLVAGCADFPNVGTDVATTGMPNTEIALRDSMHQVDAQMGKLGGLAPAPVQAALGPVVPGELQKVVTFTWAGSLEDGVRQLAGNVGYAVAVVPAPPGQAPAAVSVATGPVPVIQAFQALGDAAGTRATVRVDPARRQVEVLYHA